ncbi:MAG: FAD-binding domain-containing protein [Candidatus Contendobacter sp.]|nr:hypothetical protein [Gammaproteobacteria bacterium]MCC8992631.1 FAD-binding domain-containing protein [Candidatus Contendobacter sp.]
MRQAAGQHQQVIPVYLHAPHEGVFNPMRQSEKLDPDGAYLRQWIPELAKLPVSALHQP